MIILYYYLILLSVLKKVSTFKSAFIGSIQSKVDKTLFDLFTRVAYISYKVDNVKYRAII